MIKLKLIEIVDAVPALEKLNALSQEGKLEFKTNYKLTKIIKKIQPELQDYHAEKQKLLEKFGKEILDEETKKPTGQYQIENPDEFMKYMKDLMEIEVELTNVYKFNDEDLESVKELNVGDIALLDSFISGTTFEEEKERKAIKLNLD